MSRIFLSHHNSNNREALALKLWLESQGWRGEIFLDFDPEAGIKTGTRWKDALIQAGERCEAIICLTSPGWVGSPECQAEYRTAEYLKKKIIGAQLAELDTPDKTWEWQGTRLFGDGPVTEIAMGPQQLPVLFLTDGLSRIKLGLLGAGISRVLPKHFPWPPTDDPKRKPYRGLRPLEFKDAGVYFGRNTEILNGLAKLHRMRRAGDVPLFIILGASGTGKSSFLRAGLLPRLKNEDRDFYPLKVVRPQKQPLFGDSGLAHVIAVANADFKLKPVDEGDVEALLKEGPHACSELLHQIQQAAQARLEKLADSSLPPSIILPVDQAEELFSADATSEAGMFLDMIGAVVRGEGNGKRLQRISLLVAFTIRSDRYEPLQTAPELKGIERELFDDLRPMPPTQFREVITGPASRALVDGHPLEVEEQLIARLVSDCAKGADTLPLLGLILDKLFRKYGGDGKLELGEYLRMGELADIIRSEAESILSSDKGKREVELGQLHAAFIPYLVTVDRENNQAIRRVARMADLPRDSQPLVHALIEKRLLLSDFRNQEQVVEVAHESLFRQWDVLKEWIGKEEEDLKEASRLEEETKIWLKKGKKDEYLRRGERLIRGEGLATKPAYCRQLESVREFLKASRDSEDRRVQERLRAEREKQEAAEKLAKQFRQATALRLNAEAQATLSGVRQGGTVLGLLKLLAAYRIVPHNEIQATLLSAVVRFQYLLGVLEIDIPFLDVAFSPDGTMVVSGSEDGMVRLWIAQGRELIKVSLTGHDEQVTSVDFSLDGTMVVSGGRDRTVRLWDVQRREPIGAPLTGHDNEVTSVGFSRDGTMVVSGSVDGTVRLWDVQRREPIGAPLTGHDNEVTSVGFSRDGTMVVSGSVDGTVRLWDVQRREPIETPLRGHDDQVWSVAFSPDGTMVVSGGRDGMVRLWDVQRRETIGVPLTGHEASVSSVAFSPDGTMVVSGSADGTVRLWDVQRQEPIGVPLTGHDDRVTRVAFSPNGTMVVSGSADKTVRLWEVQRNELIGAPLTSHDDRVWSVAFSSDGTTVVSGSADKTVRFWDVQRREPIRKPLTGHDDEVTRAAFSPDGTMVVSGSGDGMVWLWDVQRQEPIGTPLTGHGDGVSSVAFSADGTMVVSGSADKTVRFWDVQRRELIGVPPLTGHDDQVTSVAFSLDGTMVVSGSADKTVRLWDVQRREPIGVSLTGHKGWVTSVTFSPDGTLVVSGSADKTVRFWDVQRREPIGAPLTGHKDWVTSVTFSPDGTLVVSGSADKTVRFWDVQRREPIGAPLTGHEASVSSVAFSPDGTLVVSGSADKTVRFWPAPKAWLDLLSAKLIRNMSRKEWREHVSPDIDYIEQCSGLPISPDKPDQQLSHNEKNG